MPGEQVTWDVVTRTAPPMLADYVFDYIGYRNEAGTFRQTLSNPDFNPDDMRQAPRLAG